MFLRTVLPSALAFVIGYTISPSYGVDTMFCNGFEECPAADPALEARVAALEALLANVSRGTDPNTGQDTLKLTGMNLQVVDGTNNTDGPPNGKGNVIIGYNELGNPLGDYRTGSHMLVIGRYNTYTSYGGMVVGANNTVTGAQASITGGSSNTASDVYAVVSGGYFNTASNDYTSVSGGYSNSAQALYSTISGGSLNITNGQYSSISGGLNNLTTGTYSWVGGGETNTASGGGSSVSGGTYNQATGGQSSVSGGAQNEAAGSRSAVSGGQTRSASANNCWEGGAVVDC